MTAKSRRRKIDKRRKIDERPKSHNVEEAASQSSHREQLKVKPKPTRGKDGRFIKAPDR